MRPLELSSDEREALEARVRSTRCARELRHGLALLWLSAGINRGDAARLLRADRKSIYNWVEEFLHHGIDSLVYPQDRQWDRGGRPSVWSEDIQDALESLLSHRPDQLGYSSATWTTGLLKQHLSRWFREEISESTLRRHLHALGYRWKRPRYVLTPDPERDRKMAKIRKKVASLDPNTAILFMDETDLLLFPSLRSSWTLRGTQARVEIHGGNEKRVIFGAINARTGTRIVLARDRQRAEDFQFFLRQVRWHYRRWKVALLLDSDPSHIAKTSQILARALEVELIWLPKRCPELNPIESLWGKTKDLLAANRQYEDLDDQVDQFVMYLQDLSPQEALRKSGLLSSNFWLWKNGE